MSLNAHDNLVLVAPRPVRIAAPVPYPQFHSALVHRPQPRATTIRFVSSPSDAFEKLKLGDESQDEDTKPDFSSSSERDLVSASPRASPRSTPPSEALEEFLSILRPSSILFPPTSPILRPSNGIAHGFVPYRPPPSCGLSPAMTNEGLGMTIYDRADNESKENDVPYPFKIFGTQHLASPVSRTQTRNPFPHQVDDQTAVTAYITEHIDTPSPTTAQSAQASTHSPSAALSPAGVPLPLPTPDEMEPECVS